MMMMMCIPGLEPKKMEVWPRSSPGSDEPLFKGSWPPSQQIDGKVHSLCQKPLELHNRLQMHSKGAPNALIKYRGVSALEHDVVLAMGIILKGAQDSPWPASCSRSVMANPLGSVCQNRRKCLTWLCWDVNFPRKEKRNNSL